MPAEPGDLILLVGTMKGAYLFRSGPDRGEFSMDGPHFPGQAIYALAFDGRGGRQRLLAGTESSHWGAVVRTSDDFGQSWTDPADGNVRFPEGSGGALKRVWQLLPAGADQPDLVYAGVEPAALFRSSDGGDHYELVTGLWDHPHRPHWPPGGGGQCLHTVVLRDDDPDRLLVAISTGGVYRSEDGGKSWQPRNQGIRAVFLPEDQRYPEYGQCVHKVAPAAGQPDRLYLQNHWGLYRSDDGADSWADVANGVPTCSIPAPTGTTSAWTARTSPGRPSMRSPSTAAAAAAASSPGPKAPTGARWCAPPTTLARAGPTRLTATSASPRAAAAPSSASGSSSPPGPTSQTWSMPAWSQRRCFAPATAATTTSWSPGSGTTPTGPTGRQAAVASACTPSCCATTTRTGSWWRSRPAGCIAPRTAANPGSRATRASARCSCPKTSATPSTASACTRSPRLPASPTASICRTTGACTAATTAPTPGPTSPTGCLPAPFRPRPARLQHGRPALPRAGHLCARLRRPRRPPPHPRRDRKLPLG